MRLTQMRMRMRMKTTLDLALQGTMVVVEIVGIPMIIAHQTLPTMTMKALTTMDLANSNGPTNPHKLEKELTKELTKRASTGKIVRILKTSLCLPISWSEHHQV